MTILGHGISERSSDESFLQVQDECHITLSKRPGTLKLHISQRGVQLTPELASLREFVKMQNFEPYPRNTHFGYGTVSSTLLSSFFSLGCVYSVWHAYVHAHV